MVHKRLDIAGITRAERFAAIFTISYPANRFYADARFFDKTWNFLGDRGTLVDSIHKATNIRRVVLLKYIVLHDCCIAERMSWAANRKTKRIEDRAYSLFGIFKVHLPMLYGEREAAFQRLQREILKTSEDDTLFAWTGVSEHYGGLLAPKLEAFRDGAGVRTLSDGPFLKVSASNATERSIGITADLVPWSIHTYFVPLGCSVDGPENRIGIYLRALDEDDNVARIQFDGKDFGYIPRGSGFVLARIEEQITPYKCGRTMTRSISVRQLTLLEKHQRWLKKWIYGFHTVTPAAEFLPYPVGIWKDESTYWSRERKIMWAVDGAIYRRGIIGCLDDPRDSFTGKKLSGIRDIHFGFDQLFNPILYIRKDYTGMAGINIDSFLDWWGKDGDPFKGTYGITNLDIYPVTAVVEEARFWNEIHGRTVVDHEDRNFWAIKGKRGGFTHDYILFVSEWFYQILLKTRDEPEGTVWTLSVRKLF